nr:hypothetical protein [Tanacetum cinerariifolium]
MKDRPSRGLHFNVDKTEAFWPNEDPKSRLAGVFPPNIARPLHGVKLLGGPDSVILISAVYLNSILLCVYVLRVWLRWPNVPLMRLFVMLWSVLLRLLDLGLVIGNRDLPPYPLLQSASLQTKLLQHSGIVAYRPTFDDALCVFNTKMETNLLSNPIETAAPKLMKKLKDIRVSLFSVSKPCPACSKVFARDIYGDHVVSCTGIIGIKHRHNVVPDTLVDICFRSGVSASTEVDIGLGGRRDKPLRLADMLLYSWDVGLDVCVDLTRSSPLTQIGMVDFVPGRAVIDATHSKRV